MKMDALVKTLGQETVDEINGMGEEQLKKVVVDAATAMEQAKQELENNDHYKSVRLDLNILTQSKRDLDKRQKARIKLALKCLEGLGK